jgi:hypothetical protein
MAKHHDWDTHLDARSYITPILYLRPHHHESMYVRLLRPNFNVQDFIKFKLRIFGRPFEGYKPGFIHIILSLVSVS